PGEDPPSLPRGLPGRRRRARVLAPLPLRHARLGAAGALTGRLRLTAKPQAAASLPFPRWPDHRQRRPLLPAAAAGQLPPQPQHPVVILIDDALLQRDDAVVGDVDVLGADLGAALGDVAQADVQVVLEQAEAVAGVQRVHLQAGDADHEARAAEHLALLLFVVAQDVAWVLVEEVPAGLAELPARVPLLRAH